MLPVLHVMSKTSIELRRSINRLELYKTSNPSDEHVTSGAVGSLVDTLKEARRHIPLTLRDPDLTDNSID